ncbi:MAG: helix-turn-helix domain-containing protein [bacterium]
MKKVTDMNYYELLNIEPTASSGEIQRAYQQAYQTYQPDSLALYSVLSEAERMHMLERIEHAYRILMDDYKREQYDQQIGISSAREENPEEDKQPEAESCPETDPPPEGMSGSEEETWPELSDPRYLKKLRKRKGVSLQEISDITNISVGALSSLENGEYDKFPGRVYIVGFIRSYAECVGIDVQQAKAHFETIYTSGSKKR